MIQVLLKKGGGFKRKTKTFILKISLPNRTSCIAAMVISLKAVLSPQAAPVPPVGPAAAERANSRCRFQLTDVFN